MAQQTIGTGSTPSDGTGDSLRVAFGKCNANFDELYDAVENSAGLASHIADHANPHQVTKAQVGLGNVNNTSDADKPVSSATQTALNGKAASSHTHAISDVTGLQTALDGKAASSHAHAISDVTGLQTALDGKAASSHTHTKTDVGLGEVDNTSDADKPVSAATQTALDLAAPLASPAFTGTPSAPTAEGGTNSTQLATTAFVKAAIDALVAGAPGALDTLKEIADQLADDQDAVAALTITVAGKVPSTRTVAGKALSADVALTKGDVGLANVDNTSDASKPVSSATQTALNGKAASSHTHTIGNVTGLQTALDALAQQATTHHRVSGALHGSIYPGTEPTAAAFHLDTGSWLGAEGSFQINTSSGTADFSFSTSDTGGGWNWVDITGVTSPADLAYLIASTIASVLGSEGSNLLSNVYAEGAQVTFVTTEYGSGAFGYIANLALDGVTADTSPVYGESGGDPWGETDYVTLYAARPGRCLRLSDVWLQASPSAQIEIGWFSGSFFSPLISRSTLPDQPVHVAPANTEELEAWWTTTGPGAELMIRFDGVPEIDADFRVLADVFEVPL